MILKKSVAFTLPVILTDATDFITPVTGVVFGSVVVKYAKEGDATLTPKTILVSDWTELGDGVYLVPFTTAELNTVGKFIYTVLVAGSLPYYGSAQIVTYGFDDIGAKTTNLPSDPAKEGSITTAQGDLTTIKGKTNNLPSDPASESGATSNTSTITGVIATAQGDLTTIKGKTSNLPTDPTSETNATTNKNTIVSAIGTLTLEPLNVNTAGK